MREAQRLEAHFARDTSISFHFNFIHTPTPIRSVQDFKKEKRILKFASYFCYSTFLQRQKKKKHSLHFIRRKTRFRSLYKKKKNKKSKRFSRFSEKTCSRAWLNFVVERQTNAKIKKGKKEKEEKGEKTKRERKKRNKKIVVLQCCLKISFSKGEKKPPFFREKTVHAKCEWELGQ